MTAPLDFIVEPPANNVHVILNVAHLLKGKKEPGRKSVCAYNGAAGQNRTVVVSSKSACVRAPADPDKEELELLMQFNLQPTPSVQSLLGSP